MTGMPAKDVPIFLKDRLNLPANLSKPVAIVANLPWGPGP